MDKDLLEEINRVGVYAKKVPDSIKNKYNQTDKKLLQLKCIKCCCYCEGILGEQTYGRIEHLRPKATATVYDLTFSYRIIPHWCCERCNTKNKWNEENPILDPAKDPDFKIFENRH
ncbi:MAG: hypothetical protein ACLTDV_03870 [Eubacterium sp.]